MTRKRRIRPLKMAAAFTLVELLVLVGIIALLAGVLLPAVQSAREAARKIRCSSNAKQLGLALNAYISTWDSFPPAAVSSKSPFFGGRGRNYSSQALLLPFLDDNKLYNAINFDLPAMFVNDLQQYNRTAALVVIDTFICPSNPSLVPGPGPSSYRANVGYCSRCEDFSNGAFALIGSSRPAEFRDGFSNTIAFSEKTIGGSLGGRYSPTIDWLEVYSGPHRTTDDWLVECANQTSSTSANLTAGRSWLLGGAMYTHFFVSVPPNSRIPDCGKTALFGTGVFAARSMHVGGVTVAMSDGSVRWVSSGISGPLWRSLGTRNRGD